MLDTVFLCIRQCRANFPLKWRVGGTQATDKLFKVELLDSSSQTLDTLYSSTNPVTFGKEQLLTAGTYYVKVQAGGESMQSHIDYLLQCTYDETVLMQSVSLSSSKSELYVGGTVTLTATILPEDAMDKTLQWTSGDATVATVDQNGNVTCIGVGEAIISAKAKDGSGVSDEFRVSVQKRKVSDIQVKVAKESLVVGDTVKATATVTPVNADNTSVIWESSNPAVAEVSMEGLIKAVGAGKASIKAISEDGSGIVGSITISVTAKSSSTSTPTKKPVEDPKDDFIEEPEEPDRIMVSKIRLKAKKTSLVVGQKTVVTATVSPSNADNTDITWKTSNKKVVKVSQRGTILAVGIGKAKITAVAKDGSGVVGSITISVPRVKSTSANLKKLEISAGKLNKTFHYKRTKYVLTLSRNTKSVRITPMVSSKYATMTQCQLVKNGFE